MKYILFGIILGAISWAVCPVVSDRIEPFDTDIGFLLGQMIMLGGLVYVGYSTQSFRKALPAIFGIYIGQVVYSYFAVGSTWIVLGMFTIVALCIIPGVGLVIGILTRKAVKKITLSKAGKPKN
ncbi:MAG: hypothetical protein KKE17_08230 [Proteobacteria bacterium]|nr:hypothetical protein [Pseudomonadota bacterium]MBU1709974.1 hypothetical protein [Pseudomonadota bacterium]